MSDVVGNDCIWVDDCGGDRKSLMNPLLDDGRQFIIRQVGNRDLYFIWRNSNLFDHSFRQLSFIKKKLVEETG